KEGGLVSHIETDVEVACLPDYLPEYIEVDISEMQLNQILHLSDMKAPEGVEIVDLAQGNDKPIVSIHVPRIEEEPVEEVPEEQLAPSEVPATAQKGEEAAGGEESKGSKESKEK